ncbi:MAG: ImmA/IrrE family metallo-endopeptidase [Aureispira sp.]
MRVSNINREILRQTTESLDQALFVKFPKLAAWLDGTITPTFKQLINYAKTVDIPFGYFFLEKMPIQETQIPHYRTVKEEEEVVPSKNLTTVINMMEARQIWAKDLLLEYGTEPLTFAGKYKTQDPIKVVVQAIYTLLGIESKTWAGKMPTWQKAFKYLVEQTEKAGIFVIVNGVVGNNTHRTLQVEEFRGFVLYDEIAPFVFVNGKDAIAGRIFTLIHEITHVLIGESASFDFSLVDKHSNKIEQFCNQVAADFLVPKELLKNYYEDGNYEVLARKFKVSQVVIARRLLELKMIDKQQFFNFYSHYKNQKNTTKGGKGGSFYSSVPYRVSNRFFELVNTSLLQEKIRPTDAFRLTGLKAKTYDIYLKKIKE